MDKIYHYCDLNGFLSIVKNKKLWLSAENNLNDSKEIDYFLDKFHKKLCEKSTKDNNEFLQFFWSLTSSMAPMPYICSFSKNGDLLSQWRAYSDLVNAYSYACKNEAFLEEDEVRIICNPMMTENDKGETTIFNGISPLNYRVTGKTITSYFEFYFSVLESHTPILDLVLGPKYQLSRFDLELFLSLNGLGNLPFKLSKATYR